MNSNTWNKQLTTTCILPLVALMLHRANQVLSQYQSQRIRNQGQLIITTTPFLQRIGSISFLTSKIFNATTLYVHSNVIILPDPYLKPGALQMVVPTGRYYIVGILLQPHCSTPPTSRANRKSWRKKQQQVSSRPQWTEWQVQPLTKNLCMDLVLNIVMLGSTVLLQI